MKKLSFLMAALLVAMTGCQKEPQVTPETSNEGKGYVALRISLPTDPVTRTTVSDSDPGHNDNFDDGVAAEYKVNDVTVIFYKGNNYIEHKTFGSLSGVDETITGSITQTVSLGTLEVSDAGIDGALVLVNADAFFTSVNEYAIHWTEMKDKIQNGLTNADALTGAGKDDFFMSNTLSWNDTEKEMYTLAAVKTFKTEAEAEETENVVKIKVERAAAKVQVAFNNTDYSVKGSDDKVLFSNWNVDNTNKSFYIVRHGDNNWYNTKWINLGMYSSTSGRIYYAVDPNYSEAIANDDFDDNFNIETIGTEIDLASNEVAYCTENTFTTTYMNNAYTTRVVFKAQYKPAHPILAAEDGGNLPGGTWFMVGTGKQAYSANALINKIKEIDPGVTTPIDWVNVVDENNKVDWSLVSAAAGAVIGDTYYYPAGTCYYAAYIRHFLCSEHAQTAGFYADEAAYLAYFANNGYEEWDLGRYGVVRNNWYKLTLKTVSGPGTPVIPTPDPNEKDDPTKAYVNCTVEILAWNVRNHDIDL